VNRPSSVAALLGALLLAGPVQGEPSAAPPEVALKRVNLLVRDMQRSLAIYRDILGFRIFQCSDSSPQSFSYPVFRLPAEARLHFCTLDSATEVRALALTQVTGIELPEQASPRLSAPVIRVGNLDGIRAQLVAAGLDVVEPRRSKTAEGHEFSEMAFTDPDGHLVVLYQLD
jgi:catechol 2,3-dioxygenase-like lactoylglutathione lyase family enzyme